MLSPHYTGQLAALGAATCWAFSALSFETAGKRIGALTLNLIRLVIAFFFLSLAAWIARGVPLPVDASPHAWLWLTVSGLVGFVFGDLCLFRSFLLIGARLSMLMMSLAPVLTAVIGWLVLGETLTGQDLLGMTLTVTGIGWAVLERRKPSEGSSHPHHRPPLAGIALGFGGALGQAGGLVLSKLGMGSYPAFSATQIRVIAGMAGYVILYFALRWWPRVWPALRNRQALGFASIGAFFGPFLGVSLSLVAVRDTVAGVAASIMALTPVLIIPLTVLLRRERVGVGGVLGALVAVAGVAVLFLQ
ncbi:MAG TPA: DMT family transporter [Thermoanaerobaculia bacterium]|nr:DMT family transporter [Thermoanaerobaculia bacterium]